MELKLNLGCGALKMEGFVNIDIRESVNPDHVVDIGLEGLPYEAESVDHVFAKDFLEHIEPKNVVFVIEEIWRVLKPGCLLEHQTPSTDGRGAFQDPTHRSFWNKNSWFYFSQKEAREQIGTVANFEIMTLTDVLVSDDFRIIHTYGTLKKIGKERSDA